MANQMNCNRCNTSLRVYDWKRDGGTDRREVCHECKGQGKEVMWEWRSFIPDNAAEVRMNDCVNTGDSWQQAGVVLEMLAQGRGYGKTKLGKEWAREQRERGHTVKEIGYSWDAPKKPQVRVGQVWEGRVPTLPEGEWLVTGLDSGGATLWWINNGEEDHIGCDVLLEEDCWTLVPDDAEQGVEFEAVGVQEGDIVSWYGEEYNGIEFIGEDDIRCKHHLFGCGLFNWGMLEEKACKVTRP